MKKKDIQNIPDFARSRESPVLIYSLRIARFGAIFLMCAFLWSARAPSEIESYLDAANVVEYGWPLGFLQAEETGTRYFSGIRLLFDVLFCLGLIGVGWWLPPNARAKIRTIFVAMVCVAVSLMWYRSCAEVSRSDSSALAHIDQLPDRDGRTPSAATRAQKSNFLNCLSQVVVGDRVSKEFSFVISFVGGEISELESIARLRRLQYLQLSGACYSSQLDSLSSLIELRVLELDVVYDLGKETDEITLPNLPNLRHVRFINTKVNPQCLHSLSNLESLCFEGGTLGDELVEEIVRTQASEN